MTPRVKAILPWLIASALIAYVFSRVPIGEAWGVARNARLEIFVPLVFGSVYAWFLIESYAYGFLFSRFNAPVSFAEARSLRGMSYLLTPIHWNVGKAGVILRLRQTKNIPVLESTSSVVLCQSIDGVILAGFAGIGISLLIDSSSGNAATDLRSVRTTVGVIASLILFDLALMQAKRPRFGPLDWWRGLAIHHAHRLATPRDVGLLLLLKGAYYFLFVLVFYFGTRAFGIALPFPIVLAATPIIQAVGGLPITPAGLGTQQAAMLYFFGPAFGADGSEASVIAFGFSFPIALILGRCLLGVFYVRDLSTARQSGGLEGDAVLAAPTQTS